MLISQVKHWAKLFLKPDYKNAHLHQQELARIKKTPRYTQLTTNILGKPLAIVDSASFWHSYKEIIEQEIYAFKTNQPQPVIIDGGSNIGLSVIYFKQLYPDSRIYAFEADPNVFKVLATNVQSFGYDDVQLINKAIWKSEGTLEFDSEGADGGRVSDQTKQTNQTESDALSPIAKKIEVATVRLGSYLDQPIALLKLDIEGAEVEVISDCVDYLPNVEHIFIEYHSFANQPQRLNELLEILRKAQFRVQIHTQYASPKPFLGTSTQLGMDMQLNIFGYRPQLTE
jgi:FkbM family methyltransferase